MSLKGAVGSRLALLAGSCTWGLSLFASCSGSATSPSDPAPRVGSVSPSSGTTFGGTTVTIMGGNFSAGAAVTFGGAPAQQVVFVNATTITATTSQHAAGAATVIVTARGQSGSLPGGYVYVSPGNVTNTPPVLAGITVKGAGQDEPAQYATLDETVTVTAMVSDAETPVSQLSFNWSADAGTVSGSGPVVSWTAPHAAPTPTTTTIALTIIERYQVPDEQGLPVMRENQVQGSSALRLHDSVKESGDLVADFLTAFSQQLDVAYVMRNFTATCPGTAAEWGDVQRDNAGFVMNSYAIGAPAVRLPFTGTCVFHDRIPAGDACVVVPVEWHSTNKATGVAGVSKGVDQVTAVLEDNRWRLCASDFVFDPATTTSLLRIER